MSRLGFLFKFTWQVLRELMDAPSTMIVLGGDFHNFVTNRVQPEQPDPHHP